MHYIINRCVSVKKNRVLGQYYRSGRKRFREKGAPKIKCVLVNIWIGAWACVRVFVSFWGCVRDRMSERGGRYEGWERTSKQIVSTECTSPLMAVIRSGEKNKVYSYDDSWFTRYFVSTPLNRHAPLFFRLLCRPSGWHRSCVVADACRTSTRSSGNEPRRRTRRFRFACEKDLHFRLVLRAVYVVFI